MFGDLHAHNFKAYASINDQGINTRLAFILMIFPQLIDIVKKRLINLVLFGGDLHQVRKHVPTQVLNKTTDAFKELAQLVPIIAIPGNHDDADREGTIHSMHTYRDIPGVTVIDKFFADGTHGINLMAIPYSENLQQVQEFVKNRRFQHKDNSFFLGHLGISGALAGSDFVYNSQFDPTIEDLLPERFEFGFLSHFHLHQYLAPNFVYAGAPVQHNWGDKNQDRGVVIYDTDTKRAEFVPLKSPKFIEIPEGSLSSSFNQDFVRVVSSRLWSEDERESTRLKFNAQSLEIVKPETSSNIDKLTPRMALTPTMSVEDMIQEYVKSDIISKDGLDDEYLYSIGKSILTEIQEGE
jgi:DNA repair exonuclease SbcCD nuclease subunit